MGPTTTWLSCRLASSAPFLLPWTGAAAERGLPFGSMIPPLLSVPAAAGHQAAAQLWTLAERPPSRPAAWPAARAGGAAKASSAQRSNAVTIERENVREDMTTSLSRGGLGACMAPSGRGIQRPVSQFRRRKAQSSVEFQSLDSDVNAASFPRRR